MGEPATASNEAVPVPSRLGRMRSALRRRDWLGIAIEVLVVTLGVLLAFQIDQWAQNRRQAQEERQFLDRMWRETASAIEETEWAMTMHGRFRSEFIQGFAAFDDSPALARLAATPNVGCRGAVMPSLGFNDTSFQELSTSGRLNILSDPQLRAELRDVVAAQADAEGNRQNNYGFGIENQRDSIPIMSLALMPTVIARAGWIGLASRMTRPLETRSSAQPACTHCFGTSEHMRETGWLWRTTALHVSSASRIAGQVCS